VQLQKRAIVWGAAGAIVVRSLMTVIVVWLLHIPGLLLAGGLLLLWIAYRLLVPEARAAVAWRRGRPPSGARCGPSSSPTP
jgi:predicted tellurium resistance membrane protein TerC